MNDKLVKISRISGGFCQTIITVREQMHFGGMDIDEIGKPAPGTCHFKDGRIKNDGQGVHMKIGNEILICECNAEYLEDSFIVKTLDGYFYQEL